MNFFHVIGEARVWAFSNDLPAFRSLGLQTEAWVNGKITVHCPDSRVVREVEKMAYRARNSVAFSAPLILDDAACRHETVQHAHPNTEVVFQPPNTMSLIHPLDQRYHGQL